MDREAGMAVAAQHRLVRRRRRLREDVGIDLPAPAIIELAIALEEARKHRPFRLVDLRQLRASREQANLLRARLQGDGGIVERRGAGTQNGDLAAFETGEVDVFRGMKHAPGGFGRGSQRRERRRVGRARAIAPAGQHDLARVHGLRSIGASQLDTDEVLAGIDIQRLRCRSRRQFRPYPAPKQVSEPIGVGDLVEALPALGAVLRFVPGAKGERRESRDPARSGAWVSAVFPCVHRCPRGPRCPAVRDR